VKPKTTQIGSWKGDAVAAWIGEGEPLRKNAAWQYRHFYWAVWGRQAKKRFVGLAFVNVADDKITAVLERLERFSAWTAGRTASLRKAHAARDDTVWRCLQKGCCAGATLPIPGAA
jgi:hypothetical protein